MNFKPCICGGDIFHMKQRITGIVYFRVGADEEEVWNGELYEGTTTKECWKYYRCVDCGRRAKEVEL